MHVLSSQKLNKFQTEEKKKRKMYQLKLNYDQLQT